MTMHHPQTTLQLYLLTLHVTILYPNEAHTLLCIIYVEIIFILFIYRNSLIPKIMLKNTDNFYKTESSIFTINCQTNLIFVKGKENMSGKFCQYSTVHLQRIPKDISDYQISGKMFHYQCSTFYIYNIYMYHIYLTDPCEAIFVIGQ